MDACARVLSTPVKVTGASRTDAGVHALRQVASLVTDVDLAPEALRRALNALLPGAVRVIGAAAVPEGFDARRWAVGKRYGYWIDGAPAADPFRRRYAWHLPRPLDTVAMRAALAAIRGKHDFSAFCAAPGRGRTPICTVRSARLVARRDRLGIFLSADSFLHHMVRNLVGSLVEIGRGAREPAWMGELLEGRDRRRAGPTAPPHGLFLLRVMYGAAPRPAP